MDNGWIKLYRSMTSCKTASRGLNFFGAMAWLVVKANYEDGWWKGDKINRGQLFVGLSYLSKEWKVGIRVVRTILSHLETDGFLTSRSTNKGRILTICNYDSYQMVVDEDRQANRQATDKQPTSNRQATDKQPTSNRQATDNFQEEKEEKKEKKGGVPAPACTHTREGAYPQSVAEVLAIASDPRCATVITNKQAEAYFLTRSTVDWVDAAGRKIRPANVPGDLRKWMLREQQNEKDRGGAANEADEMKRRFEEIRRNGQR